MRRCVMLLAGALLSASAVAAAAPSDDRQEGSFTAQGIPAQSLPEQGYCPHGSEGVDQTTHAITLTRPGSLVVETDPFRGDWDFAVLDAEGEPIARGWDYQVPTGDAGRERTFLPVEPGDYAIVACNWQSPQTELTVRYWVEEPTTWEPAPGFATIAPGELPNLSEVVPITVVLVGYEADQVDSDRVRELLPASGRPLARMPAFYGYERPLGITYQYDYEFVSTDTAYEDRLFEEMRRLGRRGPLTHYQSLYNRQMTRQATIDQNYVIDAAAVERWLADNPPSGVDTSLPTVFLVNWYGRTDFVHHVYVKRGEPDPDTGRDFGIEDYSATIAWGGTAFDDPETPLDSPRRVWFHDLSAGPEWRTGNYNVDDADITGDGVADLRFPPIWDYVVGGPRDPELLSQDLGMLLRYVAVDLLFTPSPLYPPALTAPSLPAIVDLDHNVYEAIPGRDSTATDLDADHVRSVVQALAPERELTADVQELDFAEPQHFSCYSQANNPLYSVHWQFGWMPGCYPQHPYWSWQNLFVHHAVTRDQTADDPSAYEASGFLYALPEELNGGCYGVAQDNARDGTQSFIYVELSSACLGYIGFSAITIHEYGHHLGMSHPHDGYDPAIGEHFWPYGDRYFVWVGDEVNSVMSYLSTNDDFGQFDRDNLQRWMTAAHLEAVNTVLAQIAVHGQPATDDELRAIDEVATVAANAFAQHQYEEALWAARAAYGLVLASAEKRNISIPAPTDGWRLDDLTTEEDDDVRSASSRGHLDWYATVDRFVDRGLGAPVLDAVPPPWLLEKERRASDDEGFVP